MSLPVQLRPAATIAGFPSRLAANVLDFLIVYLLALAVSLLQITDPYVGLTVVALAYFLGSWTVLQATPGKLITGVEIRAATDERASVAQLMIRLAIGLPLMIVTLGASWLSQLADRDRRAVHDHLARTIVVRSNRFPVVRRVAAGSLSLLGVLIAVWFVVVTPAQWSVPALVILAAGSAVGYLADKWLPDGGLLVIPATILLVCIPPMMLTFLGVDPQVWFAIAVLALAGFSLAMGLGASLRRWRRVSPSRSAVQVVA